MGPAVEPAPPTLAAKRLKIERSPGELFATLMEKYENAFLLESAKGKSRLAEYSFLGFEPSAVVRAKDRLFEVEDGRSGSVERMKVDDPLAELKRLVPPNSVSGLFRFIGGAVGFLSYDAVRYWERLPATTKDDQGFPDFLFGIYTDGVVFDHARGEVYYYTMGGDRSEEVLEAARGVYPPSGLRYSTPRSTVPQETFEENVRRTKEYIGAGDIFQAVLSKRSDMNIDGDLSSFYAALSEVNPSPYMYFLKFGQTKVVGSSPEMLLRVEDGKVETFPIAGTRPVVEDPAANSRLAEELLRDPKECAEHVMLVDLARNDIGRTAKYGTVSVPEFMTVERYSHVQHVVSHVVGELRQGLDSYDAMRALFPAGTVSGAPKVRAMEIIEEMEELRRGPYAGALGYFSFNGNSDFAITIRTLVSKGASCSIQTGAGIVADSSPRGEWEETDAKARGLFRALDIASEIKR